MEVGQKVYLDGNGTVVGILEYEIKSMTRKQKELLVKES